MIKILHLYHDLLNLYGEYGNISILKKHILDQGEEVTVDYKTIGDDFSFEDYDFIYSGAGLESNTMVALRDIMKRKDSLKKAIELNKFILFTGSSYELLSESIDDGEALKLIPVKTVHTDRRLSGDVVVKSADFGELVGFINKSTEIKQDDGLFEYVFKDEGLKNESEKEGYRLNNLIGTEIIGPILVKNPVLLNYYVKSLVRNYKPKEYCYEEKAYEITLEALKKRIK
ncbi:MAG: hypothetical protein ACI4WM_03580 [Erysipelotrichaceae bacterium]